MCGYVAHAGLNFRDGANDSFAMAHVEAALGYKSTTGESLAQYIQQFEVGNEVDLYHENGIRNASYTYADYVSEFIYYSGDIVKAAGPKRIQGATFTHLFSNDMVSYIKQFAPTGVVGSFSWHTYPLTDCDGHTDEIWSLLDDAASIGIAAKVAPWTPVAASFNMPLYIGEGNSISCGGQLNISNTFAATLWSTDAMLNVASVGVSRWNFHGQQLSRH